MTTIAYYRDRLRTNKHRLDEELEVQAELQDQIAQEVNRLDLRVDRLSDALKQVEARLFDEVKTGGDKMNLDQINGKVRRNRERIAAFDELQKAQGECKEWQNLLDAWKVKGFTLRDLGALYGSDYFALTQTSISGKRDVIERDLRRSLRDASERVNAEPAPRRRRVVSE